MSEVLSQNEIDDLLKALNEGEIDAQDFNDDLSGKKIKDYDFARPSKFAKEHLKTLENIFDNYSRIISTYFSGNLRVPTTITVLNSEALTYHEFSNSLSNPVILSIIDFKPLNGSIILELSPNIGYTIIERVLGGNGSTMDKMREFTEVEKALIERIVSQLLVMLVEPFEMVANINPKLEKIETNSQFAQIISPNEMVALITLNVKIGEVEGMMNICIPHMTIEPIIDKLSTKYWFIANEQQRVSDEDHLEDITKSLDDSTVMIKALLGQTNITVGEFVNLQVGDVIKLDTSVDKSLPVLVENSLKFYAKPGMHKKKNAIMITELKEDENNG